MPSPVTSIAAAFTHLIHHGHGLPQPPVVVGCRTICHLLPRGLRRSRHCLATAIASVAAGLHFPMHNNQPEAEAAQWHHQPGILLVDAVSSDMQYLPHHRNGGLMGYDFYTHEMMVEAYKNYCQVPPLMICSIQQWVHCLTTHRMTRN